MVVIALEYFLQLLWQEKDLQCTLRALVMALYHGADSAKGPTSISPALFWTLLPWLKHDPVSVADHRADEVDWAVNPRCRKPNGIWVPHAAVAVMGQHFPLGPRKNIPGLKRYVHVLSFLILCICNPLEKLSTQSRQLMLR